MLNYQLHWIALLGCYSQINECWGICQKLVLLVLDKWSVAFLSEK